MSIQILVILFSALSIYFVYDAYKKNPELKKFKKGLIIAVVLMGLVIIGTVVSLLLPLAG